VKGLRRTSALGEASLLRRVDAVEVLQGGRCRERRTVPGRLTEGATVWRSLLHLGWPADPAPQRRADPRSTISDGREVEAVGASVVSIAFPAGMRSPSTEEPAFDQAQGGAWDPADATSPNPPAETEVALEQWPEWIRGWPQPERDELESQAAPAQKRDGKDERPRDEGSARVSRAEVCPEARFRDAEGRMLEWQRQLDAELARSGSSAGGQRGRLFGFSFRHLGRALTQPSRMADRDCLAPVEAETTLGDLFEDQLTKKS
jgi:hypothetical protein